MSESERIRYLADCIPGTKITRQKLLAIDRRRSAFHEAGHFVVTRYFKPAIAHSRIWELEEGPSLKNSAVIGTTEYIALPGPWNFRTATIGWAGCLAEELAEQTFEEWLDNQTEFWGRSGLSSDDDDLPILNISPTDKEFIFLHPMRWRTFKTAFGILKRKYNELREAAEALEKHGCVLAKKGEATLTVLNFGRVYTQYPSDG